MKCPANVPNPEAPIGDPMMSKTGSCWCLRTSYVSRAPGTSSVSVVISDMCLSRVRFIVRVLVSLPARDKVSCEDGVNLAEGVLQALLHAHCQDLLHRLGTREDAFDRHPGAPVADLLDRHPRRRPRQVVVRAAVVVGESIAEHERAGGIGLDDLPVAMGLVASRPGHVVHDPATRPQVMRLDGGGVGWRSPPALELAW